MRTLASAALGLSFAIAACHPGSRTAQFGGTLISHDDGTGRTTMTNKGGMLSSVSGEAARAIELPVYAPRYPGSTVESVLDTSDGKGKATIIRLSTVSPGAGVISFYRHALTSDGFAIDMDMALPGGGMIIGKAGKRSVSVMAESRNGETPIVISIAEA